MNKKGFIATSLIYSFFLIFVTLFLSVIADYLQNKVLLNTIERDIKDTITNTRSITDFKTIVEKITFESSAFDGTLICSGEITNCSDLTGRLFIIENFINLDFSEDGKVDTLILKECSDSTCASQNEGQYYISFNGHKVKINKSDGMISIIGVIS